ncbi:MAG: glutamine--fructose-6-phosphate transaminase (isomerizing) [archaeon]
MCGIIAYIGGQKAAPLLLNALKKLEYRGYDSAGIATISEKNKITIKKDQGKISEIDQKLNLSDLPGTAGIAHTRWATHGLPNKLNAHPHFGPKNIIVTVHNGIIENYSELKSKLQNEGSKFRSETDTEIFSHLVEKYLDTGFESAVRLALRQVRGSYAVAFLSRREPEKIIVARNFSPLVLGVGKGENFAASDIPAFIKHTRRVIYLRDGDYAVLEKEKISIYSISSGKKVNAIPVTINWSHTQAEKAGFTHFTLKEIHEQPTVVSDTLRSAAELREAAKKFKGIKRLYITAAGSSHHAGLVGKYLFEKFLGIPTEVVISSEFINSVGNVLDKSCAVLAITQSGETADTLAAVRFAKKKVARTFSITNVLGSSITRECGINMYTYAGPEVGVVATKTFIAQLVVFYVLISHLAKLNGKPVNFIPDLKKVPKAIEKILEREQEFKKIIASNINKQGFFFIGRGMMYPVALEGALKLKEIAYVHAEGFPAGELKHGPLALIGKGIPLFVLCPHGPMYEKTKSNMEEALARGAVAIPITDPDNKELKNAIKIPFTNEYLSPLTYIVPLQLIAYHAAVLKGLDPDKPRNLAKSVTVE